MDAALLEHIVRATADQSRTEAEFLDTLNRQGFVVRHRFDRIGVRAYAIALHPPGAEQVWWETGELAEDLALSRLRARWRAQERGTSDRVPAIILIALLALGAALLVALGHPWLALYGALMFGVVVGRWQDRRADAARYRVPEAQR
jgi:hypothetical protein